MQYTTHFNLMLPEGTDIVNPLVQQNPNFSDIDAAMFANKQGVVGSATELTAGTVHTITRANQDSNVIRFTATSNWTAGDSMVIDSTPVSVYLSDGTTPATGAYIINTEVLAILSGSRVTLITSSNTIAASGVSFDNTGTGLSATNAQDAIAEVKSDLDAATADSGWQSTAALDSNTVQYRKINNQVWIRRSAVGTIPADTLTTIGNLPVGFRPSANTQVAITNDSYVIVYTDGNVRVYTHYANSMAPYYFSFLIN